MDPGNGRQLEAPLHVDDLAAMLAAADDRDHVVSGTWGLEGPDRVTFDEFADLLTGRPIQKRHLKTMRALRWHETIWRLRPREHVASFEIWAADSLADAPDAAAEFGVTRTPLKEGLERALEEAIPIESVGSLTRLNRYLRSRRRA